MKQEKSQELDYEMFLEIDALEVNLKPFAH